MLSLMEVTKTLHLSDCASLEMAVLVWSSITEWALEPFSSTLALIYFRVFHSPTAWPSLEWAYMRVHLSLDLLLAKIFLALASRAACPLKVRGSFFIDSAVPATLHTQYAR